MMEPVIILKNIRQSFPEHPGSDQRLAVLENVSIEVNAGEIFIVIGPSGCGKSTLLRIMSGLEPASSGSVRLGVDLSAMDTSFVFQEFALLPWLTVWENAALGLIARGAPVGEQRRLAKKELRQLGLERFMAGYPRELSGGMRQRVGIARALVTDPKIIFMDEPFSELDSFTAEELRQELLGIWRERQPTIILVTHNITEAIELGDRIAVMTPRPGRIQKIFTNKLTRPRQKRSPEFYHLEDQLYRLIKP